jgi:hypothetical protein
MTRWGGWLGVSVLLVGVLGCSKPVHPVRGTVTFEGKPLPGGGVITFLPIDGETEKVANGTIAADGSYRLTTSKPDDGARPGEYRVVITQTVDQEPQPTPDGTPIPTLELSVPASDRIAPIYADHYQSPLTATVEGRSGNEINFDLKRD